MTNTRITTLRRLVAGIALACATLAHAAEPKLAAAPDVVTDPAGAWTWFLAHGDFKNVYPAFEAVNPLIKQDGTADADACTANASVLRTALEAAPVSLYFHRVAMLCAEARHDDAAAERELSAIAALAKHALATASESEHARPIPVVRNDDALALLDVAGLEYRYAYFSSAAPERYLPYVVAAWDPQRKVERILRFDFVDVARRLMRDPEMQYPATVTALVDGLVDDPGADAAIVDLAALRGAKGPDTPENKLARVRAAATAGGIQSLKTWLIACADDRAPKQCADGLADALLPYAEKEFVTPMTMLAFVYANGMGVKRDEASAKQLLAAADARSERHFAYVDYADLWFVVKDGKSLPADIRAGVEAAKAAGNPNAAMSLFRDHFARDPMQLLKPAPQPLVDMLSRPDQNGMGEGFRILAISEGLRGQKDASKVWRRKAAEAGDPQSQWEVGYDLWTGDGVPKDKVGGQRMIVEAAFAGHARSARYMAYRALDENDYAAAEGWLLGAAGEGDVDSLELLAGFYEFERPGVHGTPAQAAEWYGLLMQDGNKDARVSLANMRLAGRGVPKDVAAARKLLEDGADKGEAPAQARLAIGLLTGEFGSVDERAGTKWAERALAKDPEEIAQPYGHWLYFTKGTADARELAFEVWQKGVDDGDDDSANDLAWVRCTSPIDAERDPAAGLKALVVLGTDSDELDAAELDTAAACQAANNEFDKAKALQSLALQRVAKNRAGAIKRNAKDLTSYDTDAKTFAERLALYTARKPYRDPPTRQ
ncbi:tetratricopeptide repeat protein [Noviluteimonas gilva]|uniref:Sel1 repeat family protein n=1 Tax=Noviluteimonas gilva TaxID=2682097 RepID=A0A7C9LGX3_9GAMM|nr:tetratricopeptide repeat protein [Lysobacter gilvus]MUV12639.1 hypothetical protein [Lysobacter gilvus]